MDTPLAVRLPDGRWSIDSFNGRGSYVVDLEAGTCTCPHYGARLAGTPGAECKHIVAVRDQARYARRLAIARGLSDRDLGRLLEKYTRLQDPETAGALRVERERRRRAAEADRALREVFA